MNQPRILTQEKMLSIVVVPDEGKFCACCPELDLVTEMDTPEDVIKDMLEAMRDYAEEYMEDFELYSQSPNRSHHLPYVQAINACKSFKKMLFL